MSGPQFDAPEGPQFDQVEVKTFVIALHPAWRTEIELIRWAAKTAALHAEQQVLDELMPKCTPPRKVK